MGRKLGYLQKQYLEHLRAASDEVLLISAADKWHNLQCTLADAKHLGDAVFDRFVDQKKDRAEKRELVLWNYSELVAIYRERKLPVAHEVESLLNELIIALQKKN